MTVVDQFGEVHATQGLRVVDGSIMSDCILANTNVNIMMIGSESPTSSFKASKPQVPTLGGGLPRGSLV